MKSIFKQLQNEIECLRNRNVRYSISGVGFNVNLNYNKQALSFCHNKKMGACTSANKCCCIERDRNILWDTDTIDHPPISAHTMECEKITVPMKRACPK